MSFALPDSYKPTCLGRWVVDRVALADSVYHPVKNVHGDVLRIGVVIGEAVARKVHDRSKHVVFHGSCRRRSRDHGLVFRHVFSLEIPDVDLRDRSRGVLINSLAEHC